MKWAEYRERLGIGFSDEDKRLLLSNKLYTFVQYSQLTSSYSADDAYRFCLYTGKVYKEVHDYLFAVANTFREPNMSIKKMIAFFVAFVNSQEDASQEDKGELIEILKKFLDDLCIPYEVFCDEEGTYIFPKGAEEFDDALVAEPFMWLGKYPSARKTYLIALQQYYEGKYTRDVADNLRKALEAFLQEFLGNEKNLESNKNEICKYLGEQGVDPGISGLFQSLINSYKNINDRIAKHNDAVDKKLLEFLLYQTGVLIRMVIVVSKEDGNHAN